MKHFKNITSLADLKDQFKTLAKANHPDKGGKTETMQEINNEYDILFPIWKDRVKDTSKETAKSTRNEFYTEWGWKGENYNINLRMIDITKIIREYVKEKYPTYKFSVSTPDYNSLHVSLMEAPQDVLIQSKLSEYDRKRQYIELSRYHLENEERMTDLGKEIMQDVINFAQTYNFDDSDIQTDYFHTNFYPSFKIGKYDNPFKIVEKQARIKTERTTESNDQPETKSIPENLDIQIIDYSEKAIVVIGETKVIKEQLAELGGKYNSHLKCGAGWVFSKRNREAVEKFLNQNQVITK